MHINAKRMKRRIEKNIGASTTDNSTDNIETVIEPTHKPDYLKLRGYRQRAEAMGLTISTETDAEAGAKVYTLAGNLIEELEDAEAVTFDSLADLRADVTDLWEIVTEPEVEMWIDKAGRVHERLTYPATPY